MMSREAGAGWTESRGRANGGSARDPAAGRSSLRSGRGGALNLPIPPPWAPPSRTAPAAPPRSPPVPGANGSARSGRRVPIPGQAGGYACRLAGRVAERARGLPKCPAGRPGPARSWREREAAWFGARDATPGRGRSGAHPTLGARATLQTPSAAPPQRSGLRASLRAPGQPGRCARPGRRGGGQPTGRGSAPDALETARRALEGRPNPCPAPGCAPGH